MTHGWRTHYFIKYLAVPILGAFIFAVACSGGYDPFGEDRNCNEFDNQKDAQEFYEAAGGPEADRHRLDGVACESLP